MNVDRRVSLTKTDSYYCDVRLAWNFLSALYLLFSLDLTEGEEKKEKEELTVAFTARKDAAVDFNPAQRDQIDQINVRAMSVKFNSRSISAFGARPSIIPGFIASSRIIRRDVEVSFEKRKGRKRSGKRKKERV